MNNEKKLYDYILDNGGEITANYAEIATDLNISDTSARNYANKLKKQGYIKVECKVVNLRKTMTMSVTKKAYYDKI